MSTRTLFATLGVALVLLNLLSACSGTGPVTDRDQVATEVALELYGTLTAEALLTPTTTVTPTPSPTLTSAPTLTPKPTSTRKPTNTPTKRPPTATPTATLTPTPAPAIGDTELCGGLWELAVNAPPSFAKNLDVLDTLGYVTISDSAVAKGQWMLFYFTLTNIGPETNSLSYFSDDLLVQGKLAGQWVSFEPSTWGTSQAERSAGISDWSDDVPPGISITALAIFDVNPSCEEWTLVIQPEEGFEKACEARIRLDQLSSRLAMASVAKQVSLRSGPGDAYPALATAKVGQIFGITGRNSDASWLQVSYQSSKAWIPAAAVTTTGLAADIAEVTGVAPPPTAPPATAAPTPKPPTVTPTPLAKVLPEQESVVLIWGLRLYDVKRAKAVYWFGDAKIAMGTWLIPLLEFRNAGSGTASPIHNLDFYLQDDRGRTYDFDPFGDAVLGAAWQFQAGHLYDDINPGLKLGIALPFDVPGDMGDVWLRLEQDRNFAIYLGNVSQMPESQ